MSDPTPGPLEQHVLLAAQTATWGVLALLTWFFPIVGFIVLVGLTLFSTSYFITAYRIQQALKQGETKKEVKDDQLTLIDSEGTIVGTEREGHLRENLSEGEKRWN
jgi:hypothetical protein